MPKYRKPAADKRRLFCVRRLHGVLFRRQFAVSGKGAGRLMSRGRAAATLSVEEFRRQMEGVYTTCVGEGTLDESPMAYKGMEEIAANISPTAEIVKRLRPVYNFKAGEEGRGRAIRN